MTFTLLRHAMRYWMDMVKILDRYWSMNVSVHVLRCCLRFLIFHIKLWYRLWFISYEMYWFSLRLRPLPSLSPPFFFQRKWKNDVHMAIRDCQNARRINGSSFWAHYYLSEALSEVIIFIFNPHHWGSLVALFRRHIPDVVCPQSFRLFGLLILLNANF